jgi:glutamate carboxypeptidase
LCRYQLRIKGEGGHAGNQRTTKESAVVELAHQVLRLETLNDPELGLAVNVGRVRGGTAANVVPAEAEAELEVRFWDPSDGNRAETKINRMATSPHQTGLQLQLGRTHGRPAMARMPATVSLYREVSTTAARIPMSLPEESRGGGSDANLLAATGLPTLDGLGPIGEMDHSENERILTESLFHRVQLLTHLLWDLRAWVPAR